MPNLVIRSIFIVLLARGLWVRARPQDPSSTPASTGDLQPSDLESEDTQKRYVIANPPRQERPGNFVRWGTHGRPNLPWENPPPRQYSPTYDAQTFGRRLQTSLNISLSSPLIQSLENISLPQNILLKRDSAVSSTSQSFSSSPRSGFTLSFLYSTLPDVTSSPSPTFSPSFQNNMGRPLSQEEFLEIETSISKPQPLESAPSLDSLIHDIPLFPSSYSNKNTQHTVSPENQPKVDLLSDSQEMQQEDYDDYSEAALEAPLTNNNSTERHNIASTEEQYDELEHIRSRFNQSLFVTNETTDLKSSETTIHWKYVLDNDFDISHPNLNSKLESQTLSVPDSETNASNVDNVETNIHDVMTYLAENDEYDDRDTYTDLLDYDDYDYDELLKNYTDYYYQNEQGESTEAQVPTVDLNTDRNQRQHLNHNLRLHSFQNTYPFESEVRGEGYHSRIRFDPFGGVVPHTGGQYPVGQTFGNWPSRPSNTGSSAEGSSQHNISPTSYRSGEVHGGTRVAWTSSSSNPGSSHHIPYEPQHSSNLPVHEAPSGSPPHYEQPSGSHPLHEQSSGSRPFPEQPSGNSPFREPSSDVRQFHEPSSGGPPIREPSSGSPPVQVSPSTYRPAIARPFVHPGNLAALLEGGGIGDGSITPPENVPHDERDSRDKSNSRPDFDYPSVANVFNDEENHGVISEDSSIFHDEKRYPQTDVTEPPKGLSLPVDRESQQGITHLPEVSHVAEISTEGSILTSTTRTSKSKEHAAKEVHEGVAPTASLDYNSEYFEFYDEFLEMYYDADDYKQSGEPKNQQKTITNSEKSLESQKESSPAVASPENTSSAAATGETVTRIENLFPSLFAPDEPLSAILTTTAPSSTANLTATSTTKFEVPDTTEDIDTTTTSTASTELPSTSTTATTPPTSTTEATSMTATTTETESTTTTTTTESTTTTNQPSSPSSTPSSTGSVIGPATENTVLLDGQHFSPESSDDGIHSTGSNTRNQLVNVPVIEESEERKSTTPVTPVEDPESGKGASLISLSEILQGIGMSLPQFLVALKGHDMTLKDFTESLQKKSLTQQQFKRSKGDLASLIEILQDRAGPSKTELADIPEAVTQEPDTKVSLVPYWLTSRPTWRPSSTTESTATFTSTTSTFTSSTTTASTTTTIATSSTTEPSSTTTQPSTSAAPPKIFGFMPTFSDKMSRDMKNKSKNATDVPEEFGKAPIPIKLDIAGIMKDKGLSASDILHDLGSLFTFGNDSGSERNSEDKESKDTSRDEQEKNVVAEESTETQEESTSTLKPYVVPENPVSLRPYRPSGGSERYRPRPYRPDGGLASRGILTNRFQTTERTTLLPPYQPPPIKSSGDISSLLDVLHNSTANAEGGSISFGLPLDADSVPGIPFSDNTHPRKQSHDSYYPAFDNDPDSLNVSTKSAILAASILGGVAMCVFLAILVVVMYRGRARRRKPFALQSDSSSSSTPPIYSSRISGGKGHHKTSGFWGTLKKRFDPYSLSPTPTVMT